MSARRRDAQGFTLLEVLVAMLVMALLLASVAVPIGAQVAMRREEETRRRLDEAREAILGFAAMNGRLPCPASADSRGEERFAEGGDALNGNCARFHDGYLPAATLGLAPLDDAGFLRDGWETEANRIRYAVYGAGQAVGGVANPLTRSNGMREATLAALGDSPGFLMVCSSGAAATPSSCGPAANQLTRRAAFVLLSRGPNAGHPGQPGADEARNVDGHGVFVSHEPWMQPANEFDDTVIWVPVSTLASRLLAAGRLP